LLARGDTVIIEQECYQGSINRLTRLGVTPIGIPLDGDGMRVDALANALDELKRKGIRPKYIYTIPTVQNPTGTILPVERRQEMLRLSSGAWRADLRGRLLLRPHLVGASARPRFTP
jgi:2-aminoadipate transaminase